MNTIKVVVKRKDGAIIEQSVRPGIHRGKEVRKRASTEQPTNSTAQPPVSPKPCVQERRPEAKKSPTIEDSTTSALKAPNTVKKRSKTKAASKAEKTTTRVRQNTPPADRKHEVNVERVQRKTEGVLLTQTDDQGRRVITRTNNEIKPNGRPPKRKAGKRPPVRLMQGGSPGLGRR